MLGKIFQTPRSVGCARERKIERFFFFMELFYMLAQEQLCCLAAKTVLAGFQLPPELRKQPRKRFCKYQLPCVAAELEY